MTTPTLASLLPEGGETGRGRSSGPAAAGERLVRKDQRGLQGRQRLRAAGRR